MVALDRLQGLDRVLVLAFDQSSSTEVSHMGRDHAYRLALKLLHGRCQVMIGVRDIPVFSVKDSKVTCGDLHRIQFTALMSQQVVVASCALSRKHRLDGLIWCLTCQCGAGNHELVECPCGNLWETQNRKVGQCRRH